jgi:hypothetical protein
MLLLLSLPAVMIHVANSSLENPLLPALYDPATPLLRLSEQACLQNVNATHRIFEQQVMSCLMLRCCRL